MLCYSYMYVYTLKAGRQDEEKREQVIEQLKKAREENLALKASLKQYEELDPDELEKLKAETQVKAIINCFPSLHFTLFCTL